MSQPNLAQIDRTLCLIDRELWIVTAAHGNRRGGLLATWVSAASIDPERPVLLAGIGPNHFTAELVQASHAFAAHLLQPDQIELAWNFANGSGRDRDKFSGLAARTLNTGSPVLTDCLAWFDCHVIRHYNAGDRLFFWADVVAADRSPGYPSGKSPPPETALKPLREHDFFGGLTPTQRQKLLADRNSDIDLNRPLHERWRTENPC